MKTNPVVHFEMPYKSCERVCNFYARTFGLGMHDAGAEMGHYVLSATTVTDKNGVVKTPGTINGGFYIRLQNTEDS